MGANLKNKPCTAHLAPCQPPSAVSQTPNATKYFCGHATSSRPSASAFWHVVCQPPQKKPAMKKYLLFLLFVALNLAALGSKADHGQPQPEKAKIQFKAFPNPTAGALTIEYQAVRAGTMQLVLLDVIGREVERQESQIQAGKHVWEFDLTGRTPGLYFIQLDHADGRASKRVVLK